MLFLFLGWKNPHPMDRSGGYSVQEVHLSERRLELRYRHVGGYLVRRAALLGDV